MAQTQRRTAERVPARFKVDYSYEGNYLISYTKNVSVDGMFVSTGTPAPVGSFVKLVFSIEELHEVTVSARVVWSATHETTSEPGMGVQFLDPPGTLRETILKMVHRIAILEDMAMNH